MHATNESSEVILYNDGRMIDFEYWPQITERGIFSQYKKLWEGCKRGRDGMLDVPWQWRQYKTADKIIVIFQRRKAKSEYTPAEFFAKI